MIMRERAGEWDAVGRERESERVGLSDKENAKQNHGMPWKMRKCAQRVQCTIFLPWENEKRKTNKQ